MGLAECGAGGDLLDMLNTLLCYTVNMVLQGTKQRFYPNAEQVEMLAKQFGCVRFVYNKALALRIDSYREGTPVYFAETCKALTGWKRETEMQWLSEVSNVPLQQALRHLEKAYTAFFRGTAKFPTFKKKTNTQSARYMSNAYTLKDDIQRPTVKLAKMDTPLNIRWSRPLPGKVISLTVSKDAAGRYFISFQCERHVEPLPQKTNAVGLDLGLTHLLITSDGDKFGNPKFFSNLEAKLAKAQRLLSRKVKGSSSWHKQRVKVARIHARIADARRDFIHKLTTGLVRRYGVICTETLRVKNMLKNRSLSKAISDAGWSELVRQLEYKSEWYGRTMVKIDQWFPSSKMCSHCGHIVGSLPLNIRTWVCPECGIKHDRDCNAAVNIRTVGQAALNARRVDVRPDVAIAITGNLQ